ncbi:MAG: UDP-N-acetylmuramoyl-L-alanyl-D-glutamate--2,6-diaminopimelate ligase [Oscillospiraceae bacterium]|nr:UDP-N-acetylmuramoyl-L-alanyl-D-glutamate--2,6-diaminopimelate ligase [Oscillospiraceae bacterium]
MRLSDLLQGCSVLENRCDLNLEITDVAYDSRKVIPGGAFVVISGFQTDGYCYIDAAMAAGASVILTDRAPENQEIPYVLVENPRQTLAICGANLFGHPARKMKLIGVTGTNGKTTVTYLMKAILESKGAKVGLIGTNQNLIGDRVLETERTTPESFELQRLLAEMADAGCTHVVMEVSSHSLVLDRVYGLEYEVGIFTNLTQDHLDFHGDMETYAKAKSLLFSQCKVGIINDDDAWSDVMTENATCKLYTYSAKNSRANFMAKNLRFMADRVEFEALGNNTLGRVVLHIPGEFSVYNALAVISAAMAMGIELDDIRAALHLVGGVKGRAEVVPTDTPYTVMIDYAHTPDALENILQTVKKVAEGRVIAVFGCGGDRDRTKRPKMAASASKYADFLVITSDNPRTEDPNAIIEDILPGITLPKKQYVVEPDRRAAIHYAMANAQPGDIIVLAGKGHETYQEINHVKHHMDERELVAEFFE